LVKVNEKHHVPSASLHRVPVTRTRKRVAGTKIRIRNVLKYAAVSLFHDFGLSVSLSLCLALLGVLKQF